MVSSTYLLYGVMVLVLSCTYAQSGCLTVNDMRGAKCTVASGLEFLTRELLLKQCIANNYGDIECYPELGCFPTNGPWTNILRPLPPPLPPPEIGVNLYCYTRKSPERFNIILWPEISFNGCSFEPHKKTVFIIHGFASNGNFSWMANMKDNYLTTVDANVFLVDWGLGAQLLNYLQVASNTRIVGAEVARFIKYLVKRGLKPAKLHLIGHSLGAHICGYAAKRVPGVGQITAMDPAQPGFEFQDKEVRMDRGDAKFLDVIHTNALPLIPGLGFGLIKPYGHVDYYMNGGLKQPGCQIPNCKDIKSIGDLANMAVEVISLLVSCDHGRSYEYYTNVLLKNCTLWGRTARASRHLINAGTLGLTEGLFSKLQTCTADTCIPLGLEAPQYKARGVFAAATPFLSPFCEDPEVNRRIQAEIDATSCTSDDSNYDDSNPKLSNSFRRAMQKSMTRASGLFGNLF